MKRLRAAVAEPSEGFVGAMPKIDAFAIQDEEAGFNRRDDLRAGFVAGEFHDIADSRRQVREIVQSHQAELFKQPERLGADAAKAQGVLGGDRTFFRQARFAQHRDDFRTALHRERRQKLTRWAAISTGVTPEGPLRHMCRKRRQEKAAQRRNPLRGFSSLWITRGAGIFSLVWIWLPTSSGSK